MKPFDFIIADKSHALKSPAAQRTQVPCLLPCQSPDCRLLITHVRAIWCASHLRASPAAPKKRHQRAGQLSLHISSILQSTSSQVLSSAGKTAFACCLWTYQSYISGLLLQAVAPLVKRASRAVLITGTPAMSRPIELYPQVPTHFC